MAIVGTMISPEQIPILEEFSASLTEMVPPGSNDPVLTTNVRLLIPDLHPPVADVTITVAARGNFGRGLPNYDGIELYIAEQFVSEFQQGSFEDPVYCGLFEPAPIVLSRDDWLGYVASQPAAQQDSVNVRAQLTCLGDNVFTPCSAMWVSVAVAYRQARTDPDEVLSTWHIGLATMHKTLVANSWEPRGVPHYHEAEFAIDRRTHKLVVVSKSAEDMVTISGNGVAPADADGDQIPTRGLPGTFESVTTGRLKGSAVRFTADGTCDEL